MRFSSDRRKSIVAYKLCRSGRSFSGMSLFRKRARRLSRLLCAILRLGMAVSTPQAASAQGVAGAPAVGVVEVAKRSITEKTELLGRVEAINRVNILARVTAFMEKRLFTEGSEVSANDQLYLLERGPFQADLDAKGGLMKRLPMAIALIGLLLSSAHTAFSEAINFIPPLNEEIWEIPSALPTLAYVV